MNARQDEELLLKLLRNRPSRVADLAWISALSRPDLDAALERLQHAGYVERHGDELVVTPPAVASTAAIRTLLNDYTTATQALAQEMQSLVENLLKNLEQGNTASGGSAHPHPVETYTGALAGPQALQGMLSQNPESADIIGVQPVLPPTPMSRDTQRELWATIGLAPKRSRILAPELPDAVTLDELSHGLTQNSEVRILAQTPSWVWADLNSGRVALPVVWGELFPTTVTVIEHPAVARLIALLFDLLWAESSPIVAREDVPLWVPVLQLMRTGLTLDDAAARLEINPRSARRRLERGMQHYGVDSIFALGVAWARDPDPDHM